MCGKSKVNAVKVKYDINRPWLTLDPWQKKYIEQEGNCFLLCGRQSGKSAAASIKFGKRAATKPNRKILMLAYTEKQAYDLFFKTLMYLQAKYPKMLLKGRWKPTKHEIYLSNKSQISCYAAGLAGEGIRGKTVTDLVMDEAAAMANEVWIACSPMLSVTDGNTDLLSTPRGKEGFYYDCSKREDFTHFYVSAEDCPRHSKQYLDTEKEHMSTLAYAQEYLAKFLDDLKRFFPDDLITKVCTLKRQEFILPEQRYFLGVDIARMGADESTFEIIRKIHHKAYEQVENIITRKTRTTQTEDMIVSLTKLYNPKKIGIDAGAGTLGVSVLDHLLRIDETRGKVVALNNRQVVLDRDGESTQRLLQEDMAWNMLMMMERGMLKLLNDDEVIASLRSIQYENIIKKGQPSKVRIWGNYSHVFEGLKRACWLCTETKTLNLWAA